MGWIPCILIVLIRLCAKDRSHGSWSHPTVVFKLTSVAVPDPTPIEFIIEIIKIKTRVRREYRNAVRPKWVERYTLQQ